jgi:hypothetical protein
MHGFLQWGLCGIYSTTVVEALCVSGILASLHLDQYRCILRNVPRCHHDLKGVKVYCKSFGDCTEGVVMAALHICLLGQRICVHGILLTMPLGQRGGSRVLHPLGVLSVLSALSKALLVESYQMLNVTK